MWNPITDLSNDIKALESAELASLSVVWKEQYLRLRNTTAYTQFIKRLQREWAIETGIIEGLYTLDRGITELLIEQGITEELIPSSSTNMPTKTVASLLEDQRDVIEGLFEYVSHNRELTTSYVKEIHAALTRRQDTVTAVNSLGRLSEVTLIHGDWKKWPNNPSRPDGSIHIYCPPEHVNSEVERLISMHHEHTKRNIPPEVEAAWLHHRFTQIHPFQDGNGRVARAIASLVFLRAHWFPVTIDRDQRVKYIEALENADMGDIKPLIHLFSMLQQKEFRRAISISEQAIKEATQTRQVIEAAAQRLRKRTEDHRQNLNNVFVFAQRLQEHTLNRFNEVAQELMNNMKPIIPTFVASASENQNNNDYWFRGDAVDIARRRRYWADLRTFRSWVRLKILEDRQADLIISFHSIGIDFIGVMAASAFIKYRDIDKSSNLVNDNETDTYPQDLIPIGMEIFQFTYSENIEQIIDRFNNWLETVIIHGLDEWQRQL